MKNALRKIYKISNNTTKRGFILPFTMLISTLILLVTGSVLTLLSKQLYFSRIYKQSQTAYYAADDALACAIEIDDTYQGSDGLGIFPSSSTTEPWAYMNAVLAYVNARRDLMIPPPAPLHIASLDDIECAQSAIFKVSESDFATSSSYYVRYLTPSGVEYGITSIYMMRMPLTGGASRCAKVTINKTPSFRQIIAQGYALCDSPNGSVERAVVNTTVSE